MFGFLILYTVPSIYFYITYTNSLWTNQVEIHWTIAPKAGEMKSMLHNLHVGIIDEKKKFHRCHDNATYAFDFFHRTTKCAFNRDV